MDLSEKAVIGKVIAVKDEYAEVDVGGLIIKALFLNEIKVGDYVIVHEELIIKVLDIDLLTNNIKNLN